MAGTLEKLALAQDGPLSDGRLSMVVGYYLWPYKVDKDMVVSQTYRFVGADEEDFCLDLQLETQNDRSIQTFYWHHNKTLFVFFNYLSITQVI